MTADIVSAGADLAARTRAAQGLPPTIEDPGAVGAIAAIVAAACRRQGHAEAPAHHADASAAS